MLEDYAKNNGYTNTVHFTDDGFSGGWYPLFFAFSGGYIGVYSTPSRGWGTRLFCFSHKPTSKSEVSKMSDAASGTAEQGSQKATEVKPPAPGKAKAADKGER